ncbi:RPAP1-like protein [Rhypophila decipiens]|uniref:RPAP1-like protein n=1 Tax=Rhypophila decipiens TaxID=261697 RepID=A0AAN7BEQ4_9PEZI|nr:RPAP1-like protein [Rhypophila decipiens]
MESTLQIFDVQEREVGSPKPPSFPAPAAASTTGFPGHKKRVSAFKKKRQSQAEDASTSTTSQHGMPKNNAPSSGPKKPESEKETIDKENRALLDHMSPTEIADAQREIFKNLDPSLIQMLLRRANLDDGAGPSNFDGPPANEPTETNASQPAPSDQTPDPKVADTSEPPKEEEPDKEKKQKKSVRFDDDSESQLPPATTTTDIPALPTNKTTHFPPAAPGDPDLDPSDPDFLENLHKKYFPNLPADPSKLAWMAPLPTPNSSADRESPYYPGQDDFPISSLRFDFRGRLLPPRVSRVIPVTKGLHHHGEAPEAAGYTIPELARLARSSVPGQRCIAYQTLGRMLYRLGQGEWGTGAGGRGGEEDDLAFGLWRCFSEGRVLQSMEEEAALPEGVGHMSSKAYAVEALWLFEKGGWKEKWRGL